MQSRNGMNISTLLFSSFWRTGGNGATGGRGNAVFGTCLATGEKSRWERYDVLGEIKPECMPDWAKEALTKIKEQQKEKKQKNREER